MKNKMFVFDQVSSWLKLVVASSIMVTSCTTETEDVTLASETSLGLSSKSVELDIYGISSDTEHHKNSNIEKAIDDSEDTKWLAYGDDVNVDIDLGAVQKVDYVKISFYEGDDKAFDFEAYALVDGEYVKIGSKESSGTNTRPDIYDFSDRETQYLRIKFQGNDVDLSNGVNDIEVWGTMLNDPTVEPPTEGFGPASVSVGTFDWEKWYVSVPIDRADGSGKATSIYYEDILALNFSEEEQYYFDMNKDGSFKMNTKFTGYTTSGYYDSFASKYCRTELREYWQGNQTTADNWYMDEGVHELEATLSVQKCEGEGKTYVAQIHGTAGTSLSGDQELTGGPATIKVQWYDNDIILEYYTVEGLVDNVWTSASGTVGKATIGEVGNNKFTVRLKTEAGKFYLALYCEATGVDTGYIQYYDYLGNGYEYPGYFKTGNYFRHDEDYTSVSEVTLYSAVTNHTTTNSSL